MNKEKDKNFIFIKPYYKIVFKKLFLEKDNIDIMIDFLNDILNRCEIPILDLDFIELRKGHKKVPDEEIFPESSLNVKKETRNESKEINNKSKDKEINNESKEKYSYYYTEEILINENQYYDYYYFDDFIIRAKTKTEIVYADLQIHNDCKYLGSIFQKSMQLLNKISSFNHSIDKENPGVIKINLLKEIFFDFDERGNRGLSINKSENENNKNKNNVIRNESFKNEITLNFIELPKYVNLEEEKEEEIIKKEKNPWILFLIDPNNKYFMKKNTPKSFVKARAILLNLQNDASFMKKYDNETEEEIKEFLNKTFFNLEFTKKIDMNEIRNSMMSFHFNDSQLLEIVKFFNDKNYLIRDLANVLNLENEEILIELCKKHNLKNVIDTKGKKRIIEDN